MPLVNGTLTDFGLDPIAGLTPRLVFMPASPGVAGLNVLTTLPVEVTPAANGYFEVDLASTQTIAPATYYIVKITWIDAAQNRRHRSELLPWKLFVPPEGGALGDLLRVPSNPALTFTGTEAPYNPAVGSWWLDPTTGDLSEFSQDGVTWEHKANVRGPAGYNATGAAADAAALAAFTAETAGPNAFSAALRAAYGRNAIVWRPAGADATANRMSLQAAVNTAIAAGADLLLQVVGTCDLDGTVNVTGKIRIFGLGRGVTTLHQITKPLPTFYVTGQDVTFEDFTGSGDGPSFTMSVATFQNYNVIRIERGAHGFTARRLGFKNHYIGLMFRNYPNDPLTGVTVAPVRTARVVVEDIVVDGVWSALHGGPFDSPHIDNIRGRYVNATGHADTAGHAPHLVYINAPNPADGNRTEAYYTRGGTITNLSAWDGPDYVGAAFSFKYMRGSQIDNLSARNCRGIIELMGMEDCSFGIVNSTDDKYPATGADSTRAAVSFNTSTRTKIEKLSVNFAATDHGRALRFENGSDDNEVENLTVVERGTLARNTGNPNGDIGFAVHLQGNRNTVKNADITNLGAAKWCAFLVTGTGSKGRTINPKINGAGYDAHIRVDISHLDALVDYDPINLTLDRTIATARLAITAGARTVVRDRSLGQTLPAGFLDEFSRGVTVNGLATTDDGKTWVYRDSGNPGNPASWQATAGGVADYVGAAPRAIAMADGVAASGTLKTTIGAMPTGNAAGLAARATDWSNYIGLGFNYGNGDGKLNLFKRVDGVLTTIIQSAAPVLAAGSVVELVLAGTSVSAKVDGVQVIAPQTITEFATITTHGLLHNSAETALTWQRVEFIPA